MTRLAILVIILIYLSSLIFIGISLAGDKSLVLHLTFDEDKGNNVTDYSGNNNNGTIKGNPEWVEGKYEKALALNGAGDTIEIPHDDSLNMTNAVTMEMWVKLAADGGNDSEVGLEKGGWEAGEYGLYAFYVPGNGSAVQFKDLPEACADANSGHLGPDLRDDQWNHLAGVWDGKEIFLYVDGELEMSVKCAGGTLGKNKQSIYIGSRTASVRFLKGAVDEVRIYNRALSETEVKKDVKTFGPSAVSKASKLAVTWGRMKCFEK